MNAADSEQRETAPIWKAAAGFFIAALLIAAADVPVRFFYDAHRLPNFMVFGAAIIAACGWFFLPAARRGAASAERAVAPLGFSAEAWSMFAVFAAFLVLYAASGGVTPSPNNIPVLQAAALLQGHFRIDPGAVIEPVIFGSLNYQLHPVFPAVLLTPFVAIWGDNTNQSVIALLIGAMDIALAWRLLGRMGLSPGTRVWLTVFFGAGTMMWWETIEGESWDMTRILAAGFTLGALGEVFGKARPGIVGLLAGLAALARYELAPEFPIYLGLVYARRRNWKELIWMAPGFALAGAIFVALNEFRYGTWNDIGWSLIAGDQPLFQADYFARNLYAMMFRTFNLDQSRFPYLHPVRNGQALTFTSPAFVLALKPDLRKLTPLLAAMGAFVAILPALFFFWDGAPQAGARHYVSAFPFFLVLMALGMPRRADQFTKILLVVSLALVGLTVWHIQVWGVG